MSTVPIAPSLFDAPPVPVTAAASDWIMGVLTGSLTSTLCILAVAFVGLALMSGRLAVRDAARVAIGCFVLLGASSIAAGFLVAAGDMRPALPIEPSSVNAMPPPPPLPPANYDPYAGASLRRD